MFFTLARLALAARYAGFFQPFFSTFLPLFFLMKNVLQPQAAARDGCRPARRRPWAAAALLLGLLALPGRPALAQCPTPTGLAVSNITGNSAQLAFTGGAGVTSYTVTYTSPSLSMPVTLNPNPTTTTVALTNLLPASGYTVTVTSNCGGTSSGGATVSFATTALNDEPCTAQALPLGGSTCTPLNGTLAGATATVPNGYSPVSCGGGQGADDV